MARGRASGPTSTGSSSSRRPPPTRGCARRPRASRGFVYAASTMGVTGARATVGDAARTLVARTRRGAAGPRALRRARRLERRPGRGGRRLRRRRHRRLGLRAGAARGPGRRRRPARWPRTSPPASAARGCRHDRPRLHPQPRRASGSSGRCRCGPTRCASSPASSPRSGSAERRWVARGGAPGDVLDIAIWAVPFGIVGGRIYHVITSPQAYFGEGGDPLRAFAIWEGGLGIWGAIAFGGVGAWIACRRRGIPLPAFADALAPGLAGRPGDRPARQLVQPGAVRPPDRPAVGPGDRPRTPARRGTVGRRSAFHPTFLYELLWNLAAAAVVIWADRRFRLGARPGLRALRRRSTAPAGCGSSCCASTTANRSSASGSTCSPPSSWAARRGLPRLAARPAPRGHHPRRGVRRRRAGGDAVARGPGRRRAPGRRTRTATAPPGPAGRAREDASPRCPGMRGTRGA